MTKTAKKARERANNVSFHLPQNIKDKLKAKLKENARIGEFPVNMSEFFVRKARDYTREENAR